MAVLKGNAHVDLRPFGGRTPNVEGSIYFEFDSDDYREVAALGVYRSKDFHTSPPAERSEELCKLALSRGPKAGKTAHFLNLSELVVKEAAHSQELAHA